MTGRKTLDWTKGKTLGLNINDFIMKTIRSHQLQIAQRELLTLIKGEYGCGYTSAHDMLSKFLEDYEAYYRLVKVRVWPHNIVIRKGRRLTLLPAYLTRTEET